MVEYGSKFRISQLLSCVHTVPVIHSDETAPETLGQRLKRLRLAKGLSQNQLARLAGLSDGNHVYELESGKRKTMYPHTAQRYADALDVSASYLLQGWEMYEPGRDPMDAPLPQILKRKTRLSEPNVVAVVNIINALEAQDALEEHTAGDGE